MCLYDRNIQFLKEQYPYVVWNEQFEDKNNSHKICVMEDKKQNPVICVLSDDHIWRLGSCYDAELAADVWVEQFENVNYRTIFIVMGIGSGIYVKKLAEKYPDQYIIVCEPDKELFSAYLQTQDMERNFSKNVFLAAGEKAVAIYIELVGKLVNYDNKKEIIFVSIPNYNHINSDILLEYKKQYRNHIERLIFIRNTLIMDEASRAKNELRNLFLFYKQYSIGQLYENARKIHPEKYAAIVVAAGPSLDKNIDQLKKAKGKAFIIAVDTALKAVINAGIEPDLAIMIDPEKEPDLFENERIKNLPLCVSTAGNNIIMVKHKGKLFFPTGESKITKKLALIYKRGIYTVATGGSVANNAFSIVGAMGFGTIILIGQDLAYPNGQVHTLSAYENEEYIDRDAGKYYEVEDIYGGKVYTEANMDCYRRWFEDQICINPQIKVIDATEGGAKIHGTEVMTLKEAIDKTCNFEKQLDFGEIVNPKETLFSDVEQKQIEAYYINIEQELTEIRKLLKKQVDNYRKLEELELKGKQHKKEYTKIVKKTTDTLNEIEKSELLELIQLYRNIVEYNVLDNINNNEDKTLSESIKAVRGGRMICEAYIENIDDIKEKWHKLLVESKLINE